MQGHGVFSQVDTLFTLEFISDVVNQDFVKVVATQVCITASTQYLKDLGVAARSAARDFQHGNIKRSTTEVEDDDLLVLFLVEPIGQSGGGWFIDNASHFQAGDLSCVFRRLSLRIVEVGRYGNDSLVHFMT